MVRSFIGASTTLDNVALHDIALSFRYTVLFVHIFFCVHSLLLVSDRK